MKIRTGEILRDLDGEDLMDDGDSLTVGGVCANALLKSQQGASDAVKMYSLANKLYSDDEVELTSDEASKIKEAVARHYIVAVSGPVATILDGK